MLFAKDKENGDKIREVDNKEKAVTANVTKGAARAPAVSKVAVAGVASSKGVVGADVSPVAAKQVVADSESLIKAKKGKPPQKAAKPDDDTGQVGDSNDQDGQLMFVKKKLTAFQEASEASNRQLASEISAMKGLIEKGIASPKAPTTPDNKTSISLVDLNRMLDTDRERTKSDCLSEASTFVKSEILRLKDEVRHHTT